MFLVCHVYFKQIRGYSYPWELKGNINGINFGVVFFFGSIEDTFDFTLYSSSHDTDKKTKVARHVLYITHTNKSKHLAMNEL